MKSFENPHNDDRAHMTVPITEFFYPGGNRGEILDSLVYVLTHGEGPEGIIILTGARGSGKSTICRLAMKQLPVRMQTVYIAEPLSDSTEFFYSIAKVLAPGLTQPEKNEEIERGETAVAKLESLLDQKQAAGVQVVLLLDEAQRMTAEVLDELRALYELESPRHKLLQIVLCGQNELERTVASPSLHKLKGLIAHPFHLNPLRPPQVKEYLRSRIRVQGGQGVTVTPRATKMIGVVSGGLFDTLNSLADKSFRIAAMESAREILEEHVRKAIGESGAEYRSNWRNWSEWHSSTRYRSGMGVAASVMMLALLGWLGLRAPSAEFRAVAGSTVPSSAVPLPESIPANVVVAPAPIPVHPPNSPNTLPAPDAASRTLTTIPKAQTVPEPAAKPRPPEDRVVPIAAQSGTGKLSIGGVKLAGFTLLEQQIESTIKTMETVDGNQFTIQLFSTENIQPDRMERFLIRARNLVDLSNLYVHIVKNGDRAKFRVTYGIYSTRDRAAAAVEELPEKYQSEFHPELFAFADFR